MRRNRHHLQVLTGGIHAGQAHFRVSPASEIFFQLGAVTGAHGSLTFWRSQTQNPITYTQLDVTVSVLLERRPPMRVLVVVARMGSVSMEIDKHV
ncbi:hypothetical protein D9M73_297310 [compost metagenome]